MPTQAQISLNPTSSKGDILTSNSSSRARLSVGTNGQILTARSTATNGLQWETPPQTSATFELISTALITSDVSTITFSSIADSYDELHIYGFFKGQTSPDAIISIQFNSNTTLNYQWVSTGVRDTATDTNYDGNSNAIRITKPYYNAGGYTNLAAVFKTTIRTGVGVYPRLFSQYYNPASTANNNGELAINSGVLDATSNVISAVRINGIAGNGTVISLYGLRRS